MPDLRGEPLDRAAVGHVARHARARKRRARAPQAVPVGVGDVEEGPRRLHRLRDLLHHAREEHGHVLRVERGKHDVERAREAPVRAREVAHEALVLALGRSGAARLARDEDVRAALGRDALAANGERHDRTAGSHARKRGGRAVDREGELERARDRRDHNLELRGKELAHGHPHELAGLPGKRPARAVVGKRDQAVVAEHDHDVVGEPQHARERGVDAARTHAVLTPERQSVLRHEQPLSIGRDLVAPAYVSSIPVCAATDNARSSRPRGAQGEARGKASRIASRYEKRPLRASENSWCRRRDLNPHDLLVSH